ncbi:MAG: hypothetical protein ACO1G4_04835 [Bacteroidota bacterium]|nr:hypothetical protein [Bacteroidia bacterium]MBP8669009.1 hypothetical protein [Bacteroidia bacterium]
MKQLLYIFISQWADKTISLVGLALFKTSVLAGLISFTSKKKKESYKVVIEKEKL